MLRGRWVFVGVLLSTMPPTAQACWKDAELRYGVPASLLYAIARVESSLNPLALNKSHVKRTHSYGIGLMQIESSHLPKLARLGIQETDLYNPCISIQVGAWLLADAFARYGANWNAVGAYNASCNQLKGDRCARARANYAWKVYRHLPPLAKPVPVHFEMPLSKLEQP